MIGAGVRDSSGKSVSRGDPAGESREGSRTARGKRALRSNQGQIVQAIKKCRQTRYSSSLPTVC
ncbi:hypothetical protein ACIP97_10000 [Peribacillus frigoritolerans]|uniref:hypothetical protein n=1 Tax=Peribacillus frigoritolerans TaxID=450367 RepID=UPI0037FFD909